jgi:stearoyl-CoA desaturase (delta-9 desaturase)
MYAHNSYVCRKSLEVFYLVFGAAALQNSVLRWARDHRIHHMKVDTDEDPYNIMRGALYAHIGWIFYKNPGRDEDFSTVPDLLKNKLVLWQDRHYLPIAVASGFAFPMFIGWCFGRPMAGLLWGGLVRTVLVHHLTFCINSLAHMFGSQPYSIKNSGRDSWWLGPITYGEGYHNFHHRFPGDYRNGVRWYQFDMTKWWINTMDFLGLVYRKTWFREEHLLRAKIETEFLRVKLKLASAPEPLAVRIERRLELARTQLEDAGVRWEREKRRFRAARASAMKEYGKSYDIWKLKLRQYNLQYQLAQARWAMLIAAVGRLHHAAGPIN